MKRTIKARLQLLRMLTLFIIVSFKSLTNTRVLISLSHRFLYFTKSSFCKIIDVLEQNVYSKQHFLRAFLCKRQILVWVLSCKNKLKKKAFYKISVVRHCFYVVRHNYCFFKSIIVGID